MIVYYFDAVLVLLFLVGLIFWVGYYTFFRKRAFFIYTASILVCGSLLSFLSIYPYHPRYNRNLLFVVIILWLALAGAFVYQITTAKCLCSFDEKCEDGKCVTVLIPDTTSTPTPTSKPEGCPKCGSKQIECCQGECTLVEVTVDGDRITDEFCCDRDKILYEDGVIKCCSGGQIAINEKDRQYCASPCGSMKCNQGEICSVVEKPVDESSDQFVKRVNELKKSLDYSRMELQNDKVFFCQVAGDTDCKMQINSTYPSTPEAYYLYDGDCRDPDECDLSGYRIYYSGKYTGSSAGFTQYVKKDIIGACKNSELFCFQEGARQVGVTYQQYDPIHSQCIYEKSGNMNPTFMSRPLSTDGKCDPQLSLSTQAICTATGEILFYNTYYIYPNLDYNPLVAPIDDFHTFITLQQTDAYDFQIVPSALPHTYPAWVVKETLQPFSLEFIGTHRDVLFTQKGWLRSSDGSLDVKETVTKNNNTVLVPWSKLHMMYFDRFKDWNGGMNRVRSVCNNKKDGYSRCENGGLGCLSWVNNNPVPFGENFEVVKISDGTNDYRDVLNTESTMSIVIRNGSSEKDTGYLWSHGSGWCADLKGKWNVSVYLYDQGLIGLYDLINPSYYIRRGDEIILSSFCKNCNANYYMTDYDFPGWMTASKLISEATPVSFQYQKN